MAKTTVAVAGPASGDASRRDHGGVSSCTCETASIPQQNCGAAKTLDQQARQPNGPGLVMWTDECGYGADDNRPTPHLLSGSVPADTQKESPGLQIRLWPSRLILSCIT